MTTPLFRYELDKSGRPAAHVAGGAHAGLAGFLTEEASWADYVDLLLDAVAKAARSGKPQVTTGNAWAVTVDGAEAVIEHLHKKGHPRITVPLAVFTRALREWRAFLVKAAP